MTTTKVDNEGELETSTWHLVPGFTTKPGKLKILHLEDVKSDAELISHVLKKGGTDFEIMVIDTRDEFIKALKEFLPDVILADHSLPSFNSHEALTIFHETGMKIPFILITAAISDEFAADMIKKGADDYILKDRLMRLPAAIHNSLQKFRFEKERQNFLDEIIKNEKQYRALIENIHDAIILVNENAELIYQSLSVEHITGFAFEELKNKKVFDYVHPGDLQDCLTLFQQVHLQPGVSVNNQYRILHKKGHYIWIEGTITNLLHDETVKAFIVNYRDITERKKAEEKLKHSELQLSLIYNNVTDSIFLVNVEKDNRYKFISVNKAFLTAIGAKEEQVMGKFIEEVIPEPSLSFVLDKYREAIETKNKITWEETTAYPSGIKTGIVSLTPVFNSIGNCTRLIGSVKDITEKHEAEEVLRMSESNLLAIFENTSNGFILTDTNGNIQSFNNKARDIFLLNSGKELMTGRSIFEFVDEARKEIYKNAMPKVLSGEDLKFDLSFERKSGETKYFSFTLNRVYNNNRVDGFSIAANDITEQKNAEELLRSSQSNLKAIIENTDAIIYSLDRDFRYITFNQRVHSTMKALYGLHVKAGDNVFDFLEKINPSEAEQWKKVYSKAMTGKPVKFEKEYKVGAFHNFFSFSINPIWENKNVIGLSCFAIDITKQKQDTVEKKKLEMLLDKTNNLARIGSWEVDTVSNTLYWSAITKQIHEVDKDYIPQSEKGINFFKPGTSRHLIARAVNELTLKGIPYDLELQIITAKGNECWVRIIGEAEFINGKCIKRYGSFQDIDARKRTEIEVIEAYEEKNIILESIGDGFYAVDKNWNFTYVNKQAEILLGKKREELIGKNIWEVYPETINTSSDINFHKAVKENTVQHYRRFNEELHGWAEISIYPSVNGLSVYFRDISEQIKAEMERTKMTADLIHRNKDLEQFSYIVSHNMRAPVANIMGLSYTLQKNGLADNLKKKVMRGLSTSVNKLDEVIKDLNNILKIRQEVNENKQVVSFSKIAGNVYSSIENIIEKEKAVIVWDFSEEDRMLTIKSYLYSIFYNLISNSLKYRHHDTASLIEIKSQKLNDKIILFFKDNGLGIDLEKRGDDVFGLYKRFHTDRAEGKGMGLYMVKTQVESIGGKISISSEVNKGTEFKIEFET